MCPQALDPLSTACSCVCWLSSPTSVPQWAWPQRSAPCCFQARPLLPTNSCLPENSLPGITHQPWFLLPSTDLPHSLAALAFFDFACFEDLVSLMTTASHCQLPTLGSLAQEPTLCLLPPLLSSSLPPGTPAPAHHPHLRLANSLPGSSADVGKPCGSTLTLLVVLGSTHLAKPPCCLEWFSANSASKTAELNSDSRNPKPSRALLHFLMVTLEELTTLAILLPQRRYSLLVHHSFLIFSPQISSISS